MRMSDWSSDVCSSDLVLAALKRIEAKGKYETARRCRSFAGRVFRYAVATGRGESDPSSILRGALVVPKVKHHAAILDPSQMGELLRAIDAYTGHAITRLARQVRSEERLVGKVGVSTCRFRG